jgi:hypothetical protein
LGVFLTDLDFQSLGTLIPIIKNYEVLVIPMLPQLKMLLHRLEGSLIKNTDSTKNAGFKENNY